MASGVIGELAQASGLTSGSPRIQQPHAAAYQWDGVARDEGQVMLEGSGGHETVDRWQGICPTEFTPALRDRSRHRDQSVRELRLESIEPRCEDFRLLGISATPEYLDLMPDLSEREDAHLPELTLRSEPAHEEAFVPLGTVEVSPPQWQLVSDTLYTWAAQQQRSGCPIGARAGRTLNDQFPYSTLAR